MINKENNFVSAVVYVNKNGKDIFVFLETLAGILEDNFKRSEIICVNDGTSPEGWETLSNMNERFLDLNITVIHMGAVHGLEASMNAGIDLTIGDFVFEFDSCFIDYDKSLIMDVYYKSLEGYDIVNAVPPKDFSHLSSRIFYKLYNRFSDSDYKLRTGRFSVISRRAVNRISSYSRTIPYRKAVYASSGLQIADIEYHQIFRAGDKERRALDNKKYNTALDVLILFTDLAYRVALACTLAMLIFMFGTAVYTAAAYFGRNEPVEGWVSIMGLISVGFFAVFFLFSIIIKYLDVLLKLIFNKCENLNKNKRI